jgi:hypothetical protein
MNTFVYAIMFLLWFSVCANLDCLYNYAVGREPKPRTPASAATRALLYVALMLWGVYVLGAA